MVLSILLLPLEVLLLVVLCNCVDIGAVGVVVCDNIAVSIVDVGVGYAVGGCYA